MKFWPWVLLLVLATACTAMLGRLAGAVPEPKPSPIESLIPAICIERDANGTVIPCKP